MIKHWESENKNASKREYLKSFESACSDSQGMVMWDTELLLYCDHLSSFKDNYGHAHVEKTTISYFTFDIYWVAQGDIFLPCSQVDFISKMSLK